MRDMGPKDRSIRNIPVPKNHRRLPARELEADDEDEGMYEPRPKRRSGRKTLWIVGVAIIVLCALGGILLSTFFAGAVITVFERQEPVTGSVTVTASINPPTGNLGYSIMSGTRSATTTVPATGTEQVSRPASGVITIYNAFSTESQRLIARTRFEAPDGKVYRIQESVDVPGATKAANGTLVPGSLSATVYADAPGESYNRSGETRYTLPALKGDPRYETMYATSQAVSGGFVGEEPAVADEDLARAQTALQQGLAQAAQTALASQIPEGYAALPGTLKITYSDIRQAAGANNTAVLSQTATMHAAIVRIDDLANAVAKQRIQGYSGEAVTFVDPVQLVVNATSTPSSETDLALDLSGNLALKWRYDPAAVQAALVGKEKGQFEQVIQSFAPAINRAEAKIRPFWDSTFPSDPEDIEVVAGTK